MSEIQDILLEALRARIADLQALPSPTPDEAAELIRLQDILAQQNG